MAGCGNSSFWTSTPMAWWQAITGTIFVITGLAMMTTSYVLFGVTCYTPSTAVLNGFGLLTILLYGTHAAAGWLRLHSIKTGEPGGKALKVLSGIVSGTTWVEGASAWWFCSVIVKEYNRELAKGEECVETPNLVAFIMMIVKMSLVGVYVLIWIGAICCWCFKKKNRDNQNC